MLKGISQHGLLLLCDKLLGLYKLKTKMGQVVLRTQVAWYLTFCFSMVPSPALSVGFFSPLPFFCCFFFPSGCWVPIGLVVYTECTSDIWVGGAAKAVVWLAAKCWIDNCCNCFVKCSVGLVWDEPTIPSSCGPTLYLVLSSIDRGASGRMLYNKLD
jgi:hypothetical protein